MYIQEISGTAILNFTGDLIFDLSLPTVITKNKNVVLEYSGTFEISTNSKRRRAIIV